MGPERTSPRPRRRPPRTGARGLAAAAAGLALAYGLVLFTLRLAPVEAALRSRIEAALDARLGKVQLGPDVRVDPLFRVRFGPVVVPGERTGDPPLLQVEAVRARPDLVALLRTRRAVVSSLRMSGVRLELPDRPGALREALGRLGEGGRPAERGTSAPVASLGPSALHVRDLVVAFKAGGRPVVLGPLRASLHRLRGPGGEESLSAAFRLPGDGQGELEVGRAGHGLRATLRLDRIGPEDLSPAREPTATRWTGGTLAVEASAEADPDLAEVRARVQLKASQLFLSGETLAGAPLGPLDLGFSGELGWRRADGRVVLDRARVALPGGATAKVDGAIGLGSGLPFSLSVNAAGVEYLRTVGALPAALELPPGAPRPAGSLDARADLWGEMAEPGGWQLTAALDLSRMREAARRAPPVALTAPFEQRVEEEDGTSHTFVVGPENPDFVSVAELPRYVVRAVTASEDAGFFAHSGFDFDELRNAAVEGAQAGHLRRGGSTISQQLAKNLFLSREKTLARKLHEAILTVALEATVPKARLMEIYLNVAEWGPGIYGIGPAARHWFGKDARELSPREAAFLATVLPSPVRYHQMWERGEPSEAWSARVDELLRTMNSQGNLTDEELAAALEEPTVFARTAGAADAPAP
ncbi:MAG TPA: biosynthetic peptidoglycan transglycosylase [Anaeromyxobacter sp.]|nr:biosynthetic peptidoglycan transglycosylase [Anaeromyxobacter sp.]